MQFTYLKDGTTIVQEDDTLVLGSVSPMDYVEQSLLIYPSSVETKAINAGIVFNSNGDIDYVHHLSRINDATAGQYGLYVRQKYSIAGVVSEASVVNTAFVDKTRDSNNAIYYSEDASVGTSPVTVAIYDSFFAKKTNDATVVSFDSVTKEIGVDGFVVKGTTTPYIPSKYDLYVIEGQSTRYINDAVGISSMSRLRIAENDSIINTTNTKIQITIGINVPDQTVIAPQIDIISNVLISFSLVYEELPL